MTRGAEAGPRVRSQQKTKAHCIEAQACVFVTKKYENVRNGKKVARWVLNARSIGYQHAALPLGWLYIR